MTYVKTEGQAMMCGVDIGTDPPTITMHQVPDSAAQEEGSPRRVFNYLARATLTIKALRKAFPDIAFQYARKHEDGVWLIDYNCGCNRAMTYVVHPRQLEDETVVDDFEEATRLDATLGCPHLRRVGKQVEPQPEPTDPLDRIVDGLTVRECLERYQAWQREDVSQVPGRPASGRWSVAEPYLTTAQVEAARLAWSAELKRKQDEAKAKERVEVVVDDDRWEE